MKLIFLVLIQFQIFSMSIDVYHVVENGRPQCYVDVFLDEGESFPFEPMQFFEQQPSQPCTPSHSGFCDKNSELGWPTPCSQTSSISPLGNRRI